MNTKSILLVEDDENDVLLLRHAFSKAGISNPVQLARDGQEAIDYLSAVGDFTDREHFPLPSIVLLDLQLPVRSGYEVLHWLRRESMLPCLPVIVFSSSAQRYDIDKAYRLGANSFVVKPTDEAGRLEFSRLLRGYWFKYNESPSVFLTPESVVHA